MLTVDVSAPTRVSLLSVKENYHRVTIKEKTTAKMFVLWPSGGDSEEGYQEEIVWTIDVDKHKDSFRGWFLNTYCSKQNVTWSRDVKAKLEYMYEGLFWT